jgi:solute:Na+ symporter, SSS family
MVQLDFIVMAVFAVLILCIGMAFTRMGSKNSQSFFEAGGAIPWWINGLSLFVSYFSAGTFVVWGSIAYKHGLVANGIQLTMVLGGLITAIFLAAKWKRTGIVTAAEYIGQRFGVKTQQFYTYLIMLHGLFMTASVLYPVGKMVHLATPLSLESSIIIIGVMIILYTAAGGLWAVLVTDVVQFIVLSSAVLIVIPMAFADVGGVGNFVNQAPSGFFNFFNEEYSLGFALAFLVYQTTYIGGNWAYVQRYTSVASERDSRKVAYLFSGLYLVSPFIWMLPPMIYHIINPNLQGLEPEGAYMMLCQKVLPAGLIGLILAGMVSATASKANTTINLVATVFAHDVYRNLFNPKASEKTLILSARIFTILFGGLTIWIAILVPKVGGIVELVLSTASIAGGALFAPIVWSLFSKRQTSTSVVTISVIALVVSLFFKIFSVSVLGFKLDRTYETALGVGLPFLLLALFEVYQLLRGVKNEAIVVQSKDLQTGTPTHTTEESNEQNRFGVRVIALSMGFVGLGVAILGLVANNNMPAMVVGLLVFVAAIPIWRSAKKL